MPRVMVEFKGGVLDGKTICSASPDEQEAQSAKGMYTVFRMGKGWRERSEQTDRKHFAVFSQPSPAFAEMAKQENWGEDQRRALMPYYHVIGWLEDDDEVLIRMEFFATDG